MWTISWIKSNWKLILVILIDLIILLLALHYHGKIHIMSDQERQTKITDLNELIAENGCIPRSNASKTLNLNKIEMTEVIRNASGYPYMFEITEARKKAPSPQIFNCYMLQTEAKQKSPRSIPKDLPAAQP